MNDAAFERFRGEIGATLTRVETKLEGLVEDFAHVQKEMQRIDGTVSALKTDRDKALGGFTVLVFIGGLVWTVLTQVGDWLS